MIGHPRPPWSSPTRTHSGGAHPNSAWSRQGGYWFWYSLVMVFSAPVSRLMKESMLLGEAILGGAAPTGCQ